GSTRWSTRSQALPGSKCWTCRCWPTTTSISPSTSTGAAPMLDPAVVHDAFVRALVGEIEGGLPLVARPYAAVAARLGVSEALVIRTLDALRRSGDIKRLGMVVRHHELGYRANAMVVWDVPDEGVDAIGRLFGEAPFVTLCYR